jgi:ATP-binding cassette, subfamily C, bacterial
MYRSLRSFVKVVAETARWRLAIALALLLAMPLTEGAGIALLFPLLEIAGVKLGPASAAGKYAKLVAHLLQRVGISPTLLPLIIIFVGVLGLRSLMMSAQNLAIFSACMATETALRDRLYRAIVNTDWLFVVRHRSSEFIHALTGELQRVTLAENRLMLLAGQLLLVVVYLTIAFKLSMAMTLITLGSGALVAFLLRHQTRALHDSSASISQRSNALYAAATEHLQNLKTVKTYGAQERDSQAFSTLGADLVRGNIAAVRQQVSAGFWFELGSIATLGVVIYLSLKVIAVPAVELFILVVLFSRLMPKLSAAYNYYHNVVHGLPAFANLMALEARCIDAAEPSTPPKPRLGLAKDIRLEDVSFSYEPGMEPTLKDITMIVPAGSITAVVGPSGAGKSTLADMMIGLVRPAIGCVKIDGQALDRDLIRAWREQVGYVASDTFLFHRSVRDNLLWARPDATEDEMREALRLAAADEFVLRRPEGLDTVIGDRGIMLSHGERQRLAFARSLLRRPSLLLLDEATSGLDSENETRVLDAVERVHGLITTVIISHRLSTIRRADLIYVLEAGRIVESGSWSKLTADQSGRFLELCEVQNVRV